MAHGAKEERRTLFVPPFPCAAVAQFSCARDFLNPEECDAKEAIGYSVADDRKEKPSL